MARKTLTIDPVTVTAAALRAVRCSADYHRLGTTTEPTVLQSAWARLTESEQNHLTNIVNNDTQPAPQALALELAACGTLIQLQAIKASYGDIAVKTAWKLLPKDERDRLTSICQNQQREKVQSVTEQSVADGAYTQDLTEQWSQEQSQIQPTRKPNLIELTSDLQHLDELLDTLDGESIPVELLVAVDELLAQRNITNDAVLEKIDNYAALIQSRLLWATSRKAEADRLAKLAESDFKTVDFLKGRLKAHLETTEQKKLRTKRFNIAVCTNGGKAPLRLDNTAPDQMPERFQRVTVEPNREAIRTALEQGEDLKFAYLAERENHLRIK